jgi:uncharacterized protein (DUF2236 family)
MPRRFAPDSLIWKICRERATLLHGPAAAVMQVAHSRIALGVLDHSNFREAPTARLHRTLDAVYAMAFGTAEEAEAAAAGVARIHERVRGDAKARNVPGPAMYSADEVDLLMWVFATMIVSAVEGYERCVGWLSEAEKDLFYRDMRGLGEYFNLPRTYGPQTWVEFGRYWNERLRHPHLGAHEISRRVAWSVALPDRPWWLRLSSYPIHFIFSEILPEPVRSRLGFRSTFLSRMGLRVSSFVIRAVLPILPARLRYVPQYNRAVEKMASGCDNAEARIQLERASAPQELLLPTLNGDHDRRAGGNGKIFSRSRRRRAPRV